MSNILNNPAKVILGGQEFDIQPQEVTGKEAEQYKEEAANIQLFTLIERLNFKTPLNLLQEDLATLFEKMSEVVDNLENSKNDDWFLIAFINNKLDQISEVID